MEPGYSALIAAIATIIGVIIGICISKAKRNVNESLGVLYVNVNAPEGQGLFLEQLVQTPIIASKRQVVFDVVVIK
jgi:hypothetical protein